MIRGSAENVCWEEFKCDVPATIRKRMFSEELWHCHVKNWPLREEIPHSNWAVYWKPVQKLFPSLKQPEKKRSHRERLQCLPVTVNHCSCESGYVFQYMYVVVAWRVKFAQWKTVRVHTTMLHVYAKVYEVTRTVIQGQYLLRLHNRSVKTESQDALKLRIVQMFILLW